MNAEYLQSGCARPKPLPPLRLFSAELGGSSSLARTYFEELHPARGIARIAVAAPAPPAWPLPPGVDFVELDLLSAESVRSLFSRAPHVFDSLVLGVRVSLVWSTPEQHERITTMLRDLANWVDRDGDGPRGRADGAVRPGRRDRLGQRRCGRTQQNNAVRRLAEFLISLLFSSLLNSSLLV